MKLNVETKQGDATSPTPSGDRGVIIAHLVNRKGLWGAGFVLALDNLSAVPKAAYLGLAQDYGGTGRSGYGANIPLGTTQLVEVKHGLFVINMVAQKTTQTMSDDPCLVDYNALETCLWKVFQRALMMRSDVHLPEGMGSGLAGGDKHVIIAMINTVAKRLKDQNTAMSETLNITLWEFDDKTAVSHIAPKDQGDLGDDTADTDLANPDDFGA